MDRPRLRFLIPFVFFALVAPAPAANIIVTTTDDELNTDGDCSLREAVTSANTHVATDACAAGDGDDLIVLSAGTYALSVAGASENAAATGDLDVLGAVTIIGAGRASTFIDGNANDRTFEIHALAAVQIAALTIRNASPMLPGGAIANRGELTITDCNITSNNSNGSTGGAIYSFSRSVLTVNLSTLTNNAASADGGAITSYGTTTIEGRSFTSNTAGARGGAVYQGVHPSGSLTIHDALFLTNGADEEAGAIYAGNPTSITAASFYLNTVADNGDGGGAIFCGNTLALSQSLLAYNTSAMEGGAIDADGSCALTLTNVTVHGNSAAGSGGGVRLRGTGTTVVLANATITSNQADTNHGGNSFGGGVDVGSSSTMTMRNTVIADNTTGGVANDCHGVLTSQGHNLLREITGCTFTPAGTDLVAVAPDLGALQDNGGATNTRLPGAGSPLLNAGDPGVPGSGGTTCAAVDERDFGRPAGPTCDIGAVERDAITTTTTTGTTAPTTTTTVTTTTAASSTTTTSPSTSTTTTSMLPTALCPNPSPMQVTVLQVTKLDDPAGNERLVLQGVLALPAGTLPIVDPAASGLQLRVEDLGTDGSLLDLTTRTAPIPPGGKHTGCGPRDGWTNATYLNTSNAVDAPACPVDSAQGLRRVVLKDRRGKGHGVAFTAIVKGAALPMPTGPIRVTLVLGVTDDSPCGVFTSSLGRCGGRGARYRCR